MEDELQRQVGRRVRAHRHGLGISQARFGEQLGFSPAYVGIIERGEHNLGLQTVARLAGQLGLTTDDLLCSSALGQRASQG